ncbi:MAG: nucleotide exchange factor GrpE [Porphyromonadaceae bacterium]|nr:nucleotide exchange factor GrpE [Porphyromonadaceae bacterium]
MKEKAKGMSEKEVEEERISPENVTESPVDETPSEETTDTLAAENEQLKAQLEQMKKDYLLARADLENFRKRTLKEKADLIRNGGETCLKDILPVIDDFERGLQAIGESADVTAVKDGIELIYSKFKAYLNRNGVQEIPTEDADFDTEYHEAVTMFPAPVPEQKGKVIECVQKGYTLNDKVIRFAKVVVGE